MTLEFLRSSTLLLALVAGSISVGHAQEWPSKPVKVIVPFTAGGSTDRMGRVVADELSRVFKQQFVVENRVGGGGAVGAAQVARAQPDGYTLVVGGYGPMVLGPSAASNLGYDPLKDFTHIAMLGGESYVLAANASLGVKTLADLIALAKSRDSAINVGSPGSGTLGQLIVEQLRRKASVMNLNHIPYRGGAPLVADMLGNHVTVGAVPIASAHEHIKAGTMTPLVVSSSERIAAVQDVPTFAEAGYPDIGGSIWFWLSGPKNLPAPIVQKLSQEVRRFINTPDIQKQFERDILLSKDMSADELNTFIADELSRWSSFVAEAGLKTN
ncbi:MAG TPA: tripartite tricarboxylate transporter substrate binding protein [Xanthobacteraceae bacterium]|jgi:tripartite-type tricarboxylate transporter receptor subunit TctC